MNQCARGNMQNSNTGGNMPYKNGLHSKNFPHIRRHSHSEREPDDILTVRYEDGKWSKPYFDCGGGNIWMSIYTVPFFGERDGKYHFKGTSGIYIDLRRVNIDQRPLPAAELSSTSSLPQTSARRGPLSSMAVNEVRLIELVESFPQLYDTTSCHYHDTVRKENAWSQIAESLNTTKADVKRRWTVLRDSFMKQIKKAKESRSGQAAIPHKPWRLESEMAFLLPYFGERKQTSNFPDTDELEETSDYSQMSYEFPGPSTSNPMSLSPTHTIPEVVSRPPSSQSKSKPPVLSEVLHNYFESKKRRKEDHLSKFFGAMEETVRTFPPEQQVEIKSKISSLVLEYELNLLKE